MTISQMPVRFEMEWNDSELDNPSIELKIENATSEGVFLEVQWGYWHFDSQMPSTAVDSFTKECPTGALVQWAEDMTAKVEPGCSKSFYMFGEELSELMAITQVLSTDLHCLWVRVNQERHLLLDGGMLALWLECNIAPLFEVE